MGGRVVMAALAGAVLWMGGPAAAVAQGGNSIAGVACQVAYTDGNAENRDPNYVATADRAEFAFLAPMAAAGDGAMLYSDELGGAVAEGVAAIKGTVVRDGSGALSVEALQLAWPHTVLTVNGQYQSVIAMAHDQNVDVGLAIVAGGVELGEIPLAKGVFDPNLPLVVLGPDAIGPIHAGLMSDEPLEMNLVVAGLTFSTVAPEPGAYAAFIDETLVAAMDEARRQDAEEPCTFADPDAFLELLDF
jgi:hypothetical protein